jgi:hypothetical protein
MISIDIHFRMAFPASLPRSGEKGGSRNRAPSALFPCMLQGQSHHPARMFIRQPVIKDRPLPAVGNQPQLPQHAELMTYRRFRNSEKRGKITDAHLTILQGQQNPQPRRVSQDLEKLGRRFNRPSIADMLARPGHPFFMDNATLATIFEFRHG